MDYLLDLTPSDSFPNGDQTNGSVEEEEEDQSDGKQNMTLEESINEPSEIDPEQNMYHIFLLFFCGDFYYPVNLGQEN